MVDRYDELYRGYRWQVPPRFNMAEACCRRHAADRGRLCLYWEDESGATSAWTYWDIQVQANRLSNALAALGVKRGDRVGIILPQRPETVVAHVACYQMGAVAMPLSILFGPDALEYRLQNSETVVAFVDPASLPNLACDPRPAARSQARHRRGGRRRSRRDRVGTAARAGVVAVRAGRHVRRGSGAADLHERHDRAAQGGAEAAAGDARQPARVRVLPQRFPPARRSLLVAGRLGLDRRPDGRAAADDVPRLSDPRLSRALRSGEGVPSLREVPGAQHVPLPHRAQDDDEGGARAAAALRPEPALDHERGRGGGRDRVHVEPRRCSA